MGSLLSLCPVSQVTISGFDLSSYRDCLTKWSSAMETMFSQCQAAGEARCLPVRYEQLVLHPEQEMRTLLSFLELQWDSSVLHHEELIGKAGGVSLSKWVFDTRAHLHRFPTTQIFSDLFCDVLRKILTLESYSLVARVEFCIKTASLLVRVCKWKFQRQISPNLSSVYRAWYKAW